MTIMRSLFVVLVLLPLAGCFLMRPMQREGPGPDPRLSQEAIESAVIVLEALDSGQDEMARSVLLRMRGVQPDEGTLAWIEGVEAVLDGRALLRTLTLSLEVRTSEHEDQRSRQLVLRAHTDGSETLVLRMSPPVLRCRRSWIDSEGHGGSSDDGVGLDWLDTLTLPGGTAVEFPIMDLDGGRGAVAAMRERWDIEMHFCYLEQAERRFPVNAPLVEGCERYLLASQLRLGPLDPGPLVELVGSPTRPRIQQLVERAVRIPENQMEAALDQLTPVVLGLSIGRTEQVAPVLTWLAENPSADYYDPGNQLDAVIDPSSVRRLKVGGLLLAPRYLRSEPQAWKRWLMLRGKAGLIKPESTLDLPGHVGDAPAISQP
jgi:hypothetical protein